MSWIYEGKEISKISDLSKKNQNAFGFVYNIRRKRNK